MYNNENTTINLFKGTSLPKPVRSAYVSESDYPHILMLTSHGDRAIFEFERRFEALDVAAKMVDAHLSNDVVVFSTRNSPVVSVNMADVTVFGVFLGEQQ